MVDTIRGNFPSNIACDDCGHYPVYFRHWGPLVPDHKVHHFCAGCMKEREDYYNKNHVAKPLPLLKTTAK